MEIKERRPEMKEMDAGVVLVGVGEVGFEVQSQRLGRHWVRR